MGFLYNTLCQKQKQKKKEKIAMHILKKKLWGWLIQWKISILCQLLYSFIVRFKQIKMSTLLGKIRNNENWINSGNLYFEKIHTETALNIMEIKDFAETFIFQNVFA